MYTDDGGAYEIAKAIYNITSSYSAIKALNMFKYRFSKYKAYHGMMKYLEEEGGHTNYALIDYCVKKEYVSSIRRMISDPEIEIMYHSDVVNSAIDRQNLQLIILFTEQLGNVHIDGGTRNLEVLDTNRTIRNHLTMLIINNGVKAIANKYEDDYVEIKKLHKVAVHKNIIKYLFHTEMDIMLRYQAMTNRGK